VATSKRTLQRLTRVLEQQMAELQEELARVCRFPDEDPFEEGTVLVFTKNEFANTYGRTRDYLYAAIRSGGLWYTTGPKSSKAYTWGEFVEFLSLGVEAIYLAEDREEVLAPTERRF
jgi:hypothetical protein